MNHIRLEKKGLRGLAIAESFKQNDTFSKLAGVIMRRDLVIDGFVYGQCKIEGDDATNSIIDMYLRLCRDDISFILISGLIMSMYNFVDIVQIFRQTCLPVIAVTYEDSMGIEDSIKHHFQNSYENKLNQYNSLGLREKITLHTGYCLYVRTQGCNTKEAKRLLDLLTLQGSIPEPIRVAQLLARSL